MSTIQRALALPITDLNRKLNRNGSIIFISKKQKKNEGELPKYYVTGGHEAIIPPLLHEYVQMERNRRMAYKHGRYSGVHPFLGRIVCENCGAAYRYSSWHSTTYNDQVWECSSRWRGQKCGNCHIYDEQFQILLRQVMATAVAQKPYVPSAIRKILQELPGMTDNRYERITEALHRLPNKIQFSQSDAIIAIKTIHIGRQRTMKVTFLDDTEITIDIPPFSPRRSQ